MKKLFKFFSNPFSKIRLFRKSDGYDAIVSKFIKQVRSYTMLSESRLISLYRQVKYCEQNNIMGDYMECGVWKGGAVALMALTNQLYGTKRRHLYLFDSFDDICPPDPDVDGVRAIQDTLKYSNKVNIRALKQKTSKPIKGFYDSLGGKGTLLQNKQLLLSQIKYEKQFVHFYKGWFEDTIPKAVSEVGKLAILRIDADWYKSVFVCLKYFYPKVVKGGFIIVDDYGYYEGCTKAVKEYFREHHIRLYPNGVDSGCVYFIK